MVNEAEPCESCGGTGWVLVETDGVEVVRRCDCAVALRRERLLEIARIPERYRHCSLESFELWSDNPHLEKARRLVQEYVDLYPHNEKQGLLLMGPVGTGKTHLAVAALQELIRGKGVHGRFVDFISLIQEIQMTFNGAGSSRELLQPLIEAELLVVDELGAGKPTPWAMDLLYYLVNSRYLEQRATIFTTNFEDPSDNPRVGEEYLADRVSARIRSRLFEVCRRIPLAGGDYRKHRYADIYEKKV